MVFHMCETAAAENFAVTVFEKGTGDPIEGAEEYAISDTSGKCVYQ